MCVCVCVLFAGVFVPELPFLVGDPPILPLSFRNLTRLLYLVSHFLSVLSNLTSLLFFVLCGYCSVLCHKLIGCVSSLRPVCRFNWLCLVFESCVPIGLASSRLSVLYPNLIQPFISLFSGFCHVY